MLFVELKQSVDVEFDQLASWDVALDSVFSDLVVDVVALVGMECQDVDVFLAGVVFNVGIGFLVVSLDYLLVVLHLVLRNGEGFLLLFGGETRSSSCGLLCLAWLSLVLSVPFLLTLVRTFSHIHLSLRSKSTLSLTASTTVRTLL